MDLFEGLNPEQKRAVQHKQGPMLVVAGAGTGKTQVITRRIAYLIERQLAKPNQILALTFTEKAAKEMEDRLHALVGWDSFSVPIMTFNAFGAGLLGRFSVHVGRSIRGGLINKSQKVLLMRQHIDELELGYYGPQSHPMEFMERIVEYIEKLQNANIGPADYEDYVYTLIEGDHGDMHEDDIAEQRDLATLYRHYQDIKSATGTFDYYDQLAVPLEIFRARPNLAKRLSGEYQFVLVDEYQDTSPVQDQLIRSFVSPSGNIFAVGDDDQSIYSFRGADVSNILSFTKHFADSKTTVLHANYRSGQEILDAAYRLIRNNDPERLEVRLGIDKKLTSQLPPSSVRLMTYQSPAEELSAIADDIASSLKAGWEASDIAVLCRSRRPLRALGKLLRDRAIPFALTTETDIFSQKEIVNLWYLLQWLALRADSQVIAHVLLGPFFELSANECHDVMARARRDLISVEEALRAISNENPSPAFTNSVQQIDRWRTWMSQSSVSVLCYKLVFETGLGERLRQEGMENPRIIRIFEDLHRLLSHMQDFEAVSADASLTAYLANYVDPPKIEVGEDLGDTHGVSLLTVHGSKGLEFDRVYLINCTQKSWSEQNSTGIEVPESLIPERSDNADHEQRRLLYVAATRARKDLILSLAVRSAGGNKQSASKFLSELLGDKVKITDDPASAATSRSERLLQEIQHFYPLQEKMESTRLPFEDDNGWLDLAVGALQKYNECPYDFFLQHVLGITEPFGANMAFGSVVHLVIQAYYDARLRGEVPVLGDLNSRLEQSWRDVGYDSKKASLDDCERAKRVIGWFVDRERAIESSPQPARKILGSEVKIVLEIPEAKLRLSGRIDAYFDTAEGVEIRDFKTGRGKSDPDKLLDATKKSFQLRSYALAYQAMNAVTPAAVTLDYIASRVEASAGLSERVLQNHRDKLKVMADRIRQRDFVPAPQSAFHNCAATKFYGENDEEQSGSTTSAGQGALR